MNSPSLTLAFIIATALLSSCQLSQQIQDTPAKLDDGLSLSILRAAAGKQPEHLGQIPLIAETSPLAVIFIAGYGGNSRGSQRRSFNAMPPIPQGSSRAYYHWTGDKGNIFKHDTKGIQRDIRAWTDKNPDSPIILIGHSYGGASCLDVARNISESYRGKLIVATLDPVSRRSKSQARERAPRIDYWSNAYISPRTKYFEMFISMSGTWNYCEQADENHPFSGKQYDFRGKEVHNHRQPIALLYERPKENTDSIWKSVLAEASNKTNKANKAREIEKQK